MDVTVDNKIIIAFWEGVGWLGGGGESTFLYNLTLFLLIK